MGLIIGKHRGREKSEVEGWLAVTLMRATERERKKRLKKKNKKRRERHGYDSTEYLLLIDITTNLH